jgi:hypothetical protein
MIETNECKRWIKSPKGKTDQIAKVKVKAKIVPVFN